MQCLIFAKEDECNDTYGRIRMYQALQLKQPEEYIFPVRELFIVSWQKLVLIINQNAEWYYQADREASKSDDLIKRDFAEKPLKVHYRYD